MPSHASLFYRGMSSIQKTGALPPDETNGNPSKLAYTSKEARELLSISDKTLRRLQERGLIRPSKALRTKLFSLRELERFLEETR